MTPKSTVEDGAFYIPNWPACYNTLCERGSRDLESLCAEYHNRVQKNLAIQSECAYFNQRLNAYINSNYDPLPFEEQFFISSALLLFTPAQGAAGIRIAVLPSWGQK